MTWGHETPRAQGGPPPNIIEASWMRDGGGELDAELYAVSIKNTVKGDSLSLTNRLAYAYGQYDNEPLPERMHQFSVMNDTNWSGRLFIGMLSYKADVLPRSIGDMEYFLAPGLELYRNGNWTLDGFIFVTNQFGYMIEDRYPVPVPFLALNYRSTALTARISVPCFVMLRAESGLYLSAFWVPVYSTRAAIGYRPKRLPFMSAELFWEIKSETFKSADDDDDEKRYLRYQAAGLQYSTAITRSTAIVLAGAYRYGIAAFISDSVIHERDPEHFGPGWYGRCAAQLLF